MQLILTQDVPHLGKKYDLVVVKGGYGRNYLMPRGLAEIATTAGLKNSLQHAEARVTRVKEMQGKAKEIAQTLKDSTITIKLKGTKQGNLYGSVNAKDLSKALRTDLKLSIDSDSILLAKPIKKSGTHKVKVRLSAETEGQFTLIVESDTSKS